MDRDPGAADRWRTTARQFVRERVAPVAEAIDREDRVPEGLLRDLGSARFLALGVPEAWGGVGGDARSMAAVLEELSRGSATLGVRVAVHLSVAMAPILAWGTDAQKERYLRPLTAGARWGAFALTEPDVGSDAARLRTRYRREGDGFVLQGRKMFISNAGAKTFTLVFATSDPARGSHGISAFVVPGDAPGFSVAPRLEKLGLRGSETTEIVLQDLRVGAESLLGTEGRGLHVAFSALGGGRVGIASCALGVAQAAFDELQRNVLRSDADWKRSLLARAYAEVMAARALVERAAAARDAGEPGVTAASVAKLVASQAAVRVASWGIDVAGEEGTRSGAAPERLLRDARVFPIVEGTTEIQELILARELLSGAGEPNPL